MGRRCKCSVGQHGVRSLRVSMSAPVGGILILTLPLVDGRAMSHTLASARLSLCRPSALPQHHHGNKDTVQQPSCMRPVDPSRNIGCIYSATMTGSKPSAQTRQITTATTANCIFMLLRLSALLPPVCPSPSTLPALSRGSRLRTWACR